MDIPFIPFLIGITVASWPLQAMSYTGRDKWAWTYVAVITLGLLLTYHQQVGAFFNLSFSKQNKDAKA